MSPFNHHSVSSVQSLSHVQLFVTPWNAACQASLSITNKLLEFTQTHVHRVSDAIQLSHRLSSPCPLAPNPSSIRVFSNESTQSILKEIIPGCSLEGLLLKLKLQYFGHLMWRANSFERILKLGKIEGRRRG